MISFKKHSGIYTLLSEQVLPISIEEAWSFFSNPANLEKITPSNMGFKVTSKNSKKAYKGQIITYKIEVLPTIKSNWVPEITQVKEQEFFIDEQRFGPYKMWHHEHFFMPMSNGNVHMRDKISYKLPFGLLGHLVHTVFIKKRLHQIFTYRYQILEKMFSK
jgi:ligand-binding SRPBCC domain-containing protein